MDNIKNTILHSFEKLISRKKNIVILLLLFTLGACIQSIIIGPRIYEINTEKYEISEGEYIRGDNYGIFKQSFERLIQGKDFYHKKYGDYFKYTPTFAVLFGIFAILPDWLGLTLWNLLNTFVLFFAIYYLPSLDLRKKNLAIVIFLIELLTALQNTQSNALIAGLIILAMGLFENKKYLIAALCISLSVYVKLFGIVGFALFLLYPNKIKFSFYSLFWMLALFVLPLLFVGIEQYKLLYHSYSELLQRDHTRSYGFSVFGWLYFWFGIDAGKYLVAGIGVIVFLIPFYKFKEYKNFFFRILALSSILIWVVIFNHRAESATFIIAMAGVALWYATSERSRINDILLIGALIFTVLSPTDLFPRYLREEFVVPYALKGVPVIFIWFKLIYDMLVCSSENAGRSTPPPDAGLKKMAA